MHDSSRSNCYATELLLLLLPELVSPWPECWLWININIIINVVRSINIINGVNCNSSSKPGTEYCQVSRDFLSPSLMFMNLNLLNHYLFYYLTCWKMIICNIILCVWMIAIKRWQKDKFVLLPIKMIYAVLSSSQH